MTNYNNETFTFTHDIRATSYPVTTVENGNSALSITQVYMELPCYPLHHVGTVVNSLTYNERLGLPERITMGYTANEPEIMLTGGSGWRSQISEVINFYMRNSITA